MPMVTSCRPSRRPSGAGSSTKSSSGLTPDVVRRPCAAHALSYRGVLRDRGKEASVSKTYKIAAIPGDGIGNEVVPAGLRVLEAAAKRHGFALKVRSFDWSCERFARTGKMMPEDGLGQLKAFDSIYLGAVGYPGVPDHVSLWGLLIPIRRGFRQYINLRPIRLLAGIETPLKNREPGEIDFYVVRENNEGEDSEIGGRLYSGTEVEIAMKQAGFTKTGADRDTRYA